MTDQYHASHTLSKLQGFCGLHRWSTTTAHTVVRCTVCIGNHNFLFYFWKEPYTIGGYGHSWYVADAHIMISHALLASTTVFYAQTLFYLLASILVNSLLAHSSMIAANIWEIWLKTFIYCLPALLKSKWILKRNDLAYFTFCISTMTYIWKRACDLHDTRTRWLPKDCLLSRLVIYKAMHHARLGVTLRLALQSFSWSLLYCDAVSGSWM